MAKNRIVNTRFWVDDYVSNLDPVEKLLFLYFLTNPSTDISGLYELPVKNIALDTGLDKEMVLRIIKRFTKDKRVFYINGWVGVKNFIKHQTLNPKVEAGIKAGILKAPPELIKKLELDLDRLSIDSNSLSHTNTNTNSNPNTNTNTNDSALDKKNKTNQLFEKVIELKGWSNKSRKEINAVFPRYVRVLHQILELTEWNVELAIDKMVKVATWADNNELDWSPETVIKKWLEIDDLPQEKKRKAYVDGDRAYQKGDKWYVILHNGEHKEYIGALNKIEWR